MNPDQQQPNQPQQPEQLPQALSGQYDFILNQPVKQAKPLLPQKTSMKQRILIVFGGLGILAVILVVVFSFLLNGNGSKANELIMSELSAQQKEIGRLSELGIQLSTTTDTRNKAATIAIVFNSDSKLFSAFATKNGADQKIITADIAKFKDAKSEASLKKASSDNNFETTFAEIIKSKIVTYQNSLKDRINGAKDKDEKQLLLQANEHLSGLF